MPDAIIADGGNREGANGHAFMQTFAGELSDAQIAAVATYVAARFGNPDVTIDATDDTLLRAGGPPPWILEAEPWLVAVAGGIVALIVVGLVSLLFFRRHRRYQPA